MPTFAKILGFVVLVLGAYIWLSLSIPQQVSLPPEREEFDPSKILTQADLIKVGQRIFFGKGQCALCHSIGPSRTARAPDLEGIGAKLTREFLYESLTKPQAYTYMDYTVSPPKAFPAKMPAINKPPVGLTEPELLAVIAYVQKLGGTVTIQPEEVRALTPMTVVHGDPQAGRRVYQRMACARCHQTNINSLLSRRDEAALRSLVIAPAAKKRGGKEAAEIHRDFDQKFTVRELDNLIAYLMMLKDRAGNGAGGS